MLETQAEYYKRNNGPLYHITSFDNVKKILNSKHLRFTSAASPDFNIQHEVYPLIRELYRWLQSGEDDEFWRGLVMTINNTLGASDYEYNTSNDISIYNLIHFLIRPRFDSYILCFTSNHQLFRDTKSIALEFDHEDFNCVLPDGRAHNNKENIRTAFMRFSNICYSIEDLQSRIRSNPIRSGFDLTGLSSVFDAFKHESYQEEKEQRLFLYLREISELDILKNNDPISRRLSLKENQIPQLHILGENNMLLKQVHCRNSEELDELKKVFSNMADVFVLASND